MNYLINEKMNEWRNDKWVNERTNEWMNTDEEKHLISHRRSQRAGRVECVVRWMILQTLLLSSHPYIIQLLDTVARTNIVRYYHNSRTRAGLKGDQTCRPLLNQRNLPRLPPENISRLKSYKADIEYRRVSLRHSGAVYQFCIVRAMKKLWEFGAEDIARERHCIAMFMFSN